MAGLLAGYMMRDELESVYESQAEIPNNHSAVLRFKRSVVGDTLNIPFRKVSVLKAVQHHANPVADAMTYSKKVAGKFNMRSIIDAHSQSGIVERYIAPDDLIPQMVERVGAENIMTGYSVTKDDLEHWRKRGDVIISTMPMKSLIELLGLEVDTSVFNHRMIYTINVRLKNCDAYFTLYCPDPQVPFYRISMTGDNLIAESASGIMKTIESYAPFIYQATGIDLRNEIIIDDADINRQPFAKISHIPERLRCDTIMRLTDEFGIYSLGRYATWRPGLLLDDIVNDIYVIRKMIAGGESERLKVRVMNTYIGEVQ